MRGNVFGGQRNEKYFSVETNESKIMKWGVDFCISYGAIKKLMN